jgi:hypothetical protein
MRAPELARRARSEVAAYAATFVLIFDAGRCEYGVLGRRERPHRKAKRRKLRRR